MLVDSLTSGPLWYKDYSLNGMQYGARQVFGEVAGYMRDHPEAKVIVSPAWANGTDVIARFFFADPLPFLLASPQGYFDDVQPLKPDTLLVMIPEEYERIPRTHFSQVKVEKVLNYPDGRPGFYFVHLTYAENAREVIESEKETHRRPLVGDFVIDGGKVTVTYPRLDIGSVRELFDGDTGTLVRTEGINPMDLDFEFLVPRQVQGASVRIGAVATTIQLKIWPEGAKEPLEMTRSVDQSTLFRDVALDFPQAVRAERVWLSVKNTDDQADANVHVWEISFR
jgi:hypothetical protein